MDPAAEHTHKPHVRRYLNELYAESHQEFAFEGDSPADVEAWQADARPQLRRLLGLERMEGELGEHTPTVEMDAPEQLDGFSRRLGRIATEPEWSVEFWMLKPDGEGPFPLAVMPHGHEPRGHDTYAGVHQGNEKRIQRIENLDADVAVQAVRRGYLSMAVNTRGFESNCIPDLNERHNGQNCHSQLIHALLAGRTVIGERVWDLQRVIDWAVRRADVDGSRILMTGNSGGGMATTYAAACDTRISVAVPSSSFTTLVGQNGLAHPGEGGAFPHRYNLLCFKSLSDSTFTSYGSV